MNCMETHDAAMIIRMMIMEELVSAKIKSVCFHKEERKMSSALFGTYASNYVALLDLPGEVIVVIDSVAAKMHPDWDKKTNNRAATLEQELWGRKVKCKVAEIIDSRHIECELIQLI